MLDLALLEKIKRLAIIAMVSDDVLFARLVLKGGNLLDIVYGISTRASVDVDFSIEGEFDLEDLQRRVSRVIDQTFNKHGYIAFDIFNRASLIGSRFDEADLSGSSFRGANCKRVCFADANLLGCDFTAAVLDEAVFVGAQIDRSTVFNGASLINAQAAEQYDRSGNLVRPGVDLKRATYDEQTRFGEDPTALNVEVLNAAWELLESDDRPEARPVRAALSAIRQSRQERSDWQEYVPKTLPQDSRAIFDDLLDQAYKSLL